MFSAKFVALVAMTAVLLPAHAAGNPPAGQEAPLKWDVLTEKRASSTPGIPPGKEAVDWVANNVTLIYGKHDAVLVDTFLGKDKTTDLIEWIEKHHVNLQTIYVTHGHPDHMFGLKQLLDHFPNARAIDPPQVVDQMHRAIAAEQSTGQWEKRYPGQVSTILATSEVMKGDTFLLEDHELRVIDTGHTDSNNTTALYVPSLGLVVSGDAIYNNAHPYLAESDANGPRAWLSAIDRIDALHPQFVVTGHGPLNADFSPRHIAETRQYLLDFEHINGETKTARELYDRMLELYPDRINPGSLWGGAHAAKNTPLPSPKEI